LFIFGVPPFFLLSLCLRHPPFFQKKKEKKLTYLLLKNEKKRESIKRHEANKRDMLLPFGWVLNHMLDRVLLILGFATSPPVLLLAARFPGSKTAAEAMGHWTVCARWLWLVLSAPSANL
jgi:hypothetical protein